MNRETSETPAAAPAKEASTNVDPSPANPTTPALSPQPTAVTPRPPAAAPGSLPPPPPPSLTPPHSPSPDLEQDEAVGQQQQQQRNHHHHSPSQEEQKDKNDYSSTDSPRASLDTTTPPSSRSRSRHQEYLDSLHPPTGGGFARLAQVQHRREKEHRRRNRDLQERSVDLARRTMEARHEFAQAQKEEVDGDADKGASNHQVSGSEEGGNPHEVHDDVGAAAAPRSSSSSPDKRTAAHGEDDGEGSNSVGGGGGGSIKLRSRAATLIQRSYRGYRVRREMRGLGIDASTRWTHAIRDARWRDMNTPRGGSGLQALAGAAQNGSGGGGEDHDAAAAVQPRPSTSAARQNWKKAAAIAKRAGGDEDSSHSDSDSDLDSDSAEEGDGEGRGHHGMTAEQKAALRKRRASMRKKRQKKAKTMGLQYFLEMVDLKHRYGSNLRQYHAEWKKADTSENFFYWLDYGGGKNIELESCPRERLAREQVRYLNREERQYYLVKVDPEGRLCWAKNDARIDTTEQWRDSIHGIVPVDDETPAFAPAIESHSQSQEDAKRPPARLDDRSASSSSEASESELEAARAAKYADPVLDEATGFKKVKHVSAATIFNKLLRKSVKKNTWIFVADTSFRLYVGIKASGSFQHSSFLQGSRISAAGLIKIKNGRLSSLSPLSGHYRPPASNFRAFVHSLKDEGVDMSRVSISKSYAVLVGLEAYVKTRRKGKEALLKMTHHKERLMDPEQARRREEAEQDKSESAAIERKVLQKQEAEREGNRAGVKFMQMLGFRPREPPALKQGVQS